MIPKTGSKTGKSSVNDMDAPIGDYNAPREGGYRLTGKIVDAFYGPRNSRDGKPFLDEEGNPQPFVRLGILFEDADWQKKWEGGHFEQWFKKTRSSNSMWSEVERAFIGILESMDQEIPTTLKGLLAAVEEESFIWERKTMTRKDGTAFTKASGKEITYWLPVEYNPNTGK